MHMCSQLFKLYWCNKGSGIVFQGVHNHNIVNNWFKINISEGSCEPPHSKLAPPVCTHMFGVCVCDSSFE